MSILILHSGFSPSTGCFRGRAEIWRE